MPARPVDLRGAIVADLPRGRIETRDQRRLVALPAEWLESLIAAAPPESARALGAALGAALERDARAALEGEADPSPDDVAYALSIALAARGLGLVHFERWGDALSLVWRDAPAGNDAWREIAAAAAASLVSRLTGLEVSGAPVGGDAGELRVLLASSEACDAARRLAREGHALPQIVARLEPTRVAS